MALIKAILKADIKKILLDLRDRTNNQDKAIDDYATALSDAIDKFVKSGDITTVGSSTTQKGKIL